VNALAPLARLQQLTELRLGEVSPEQLGQLPRSLLQLDLGLQPDEQAAAWFEQHAGIVRRLALEGGFEPSNWKYREGDSEGDGMVEAFVNVSTAAAAVHAAAQGQMAASVAQPLAPTTDTTPNTSSSSSSSGGGSSSSSSSFSLQSLRALAMPWELRGSSLRTLPACSLTELECYVDFACEHAVDALSSLTALRRLHVCEDRRCSRLRNQQDSALAPLSALQQLTRLQLPVVRAPQLVHLQLPQLLQLTATVGSRVLARAGSSHGDRQQQDSDQQQHMSPVILSHLSSLTLIDIDSSSLLHSGAFPSSLRAVTWGFGYSYAELPGLSLQPLLQLAALEKIHFIFDDMRPDLCHPGLWHRQVSTKNGTWRSGVSGSPFEIEVWRMPTSAAEQGFVGAGDAAADESPWGALPLQSVRLMYGQVGVMSIPTAAVQALGALQLTELAVHGGFEYEAHLELAVTPAQLGAVLQRLPLLQRLELVFFAMLCDEAGVADAEAQQQQQQQQQPGMRLYHSFAGVSSLVSAISCLPGLQLLELDLPLQLQQAAVQPIVAVLHEVHLGVTLDDKIEFYGFWLLRKSHMERFF
jgi:hypothetical protein